MVLKNCSELLHRYGPRLSSAAGICTNRNDTFDFDPSYAVDGYKPLWFMLHPQQPTVTANYVLATVCLLQGLLASIGNFIVIRVYSRARHLKTPSGIFYLNQGITDFILINMQWPFYTSSHYMEYWAFGKIGCEIYGFFASAFGLLSLCNLTVIAIDRYLAISVINSTLHRYMTFPKAYAIVAFLYVYNLAWSALPLFGWNRYVSEGFLTACTYDYLSREEKSRYFILFIFVFCFACPLLLIIFSYSSVYILVHKHQLAMTTMVDKQGNGKSAENVKQKKRALDLEVKLLIAALLATGGWLICWTPYAIVCLIGTYGDYTLITPLASELPAIFAKSSTVLNPIIYAMRSPNFQKGIKEVFPGLGSKLSVVMEPGSGATFHPKSNKTKFDSVRESSESQDDVALVIQRPT